MKVDLSVGAGAIEVTALLLLIAAADRPHVGPDIARAVPLTLVAGLDTAVRRASSIGAADSLLVGSLPGIARRQPPVDLRPDPALRLTMAATLFAWEPAVVLARHFTQPMVFSAAIAIT